MRLCFDHLEPRDCPSPVRTVVALEVQGDSLTPGEVEDVRARLGSYFPHPGRLEVSVTDAAGVGKLLYADFKSHHLASYVVLFSPDTDPHFWGLGGEKIVTVFVGSHKANLPGYRVTDELAKTAAHEVGHAMGLGHPLPLGGVPSSVMNAGAIADGAVFQGFWEPSDQGGLQNESLTVWKVLHRKFD